ncbi:MAG: GNAT family N-acetyltransferase [Polyangia bacterium]|jgi:acetoin utilization deacetylase AcuC-like enzyme/GNAT superfamily N-acetyltransferase|nr:GNAT family N-acetyltransferase [Polyangia bacterium]
MFRIRRIHDDLLPTNRVVLRQVQELLGERFSGIPAVEIESLGERLRNPFLQRFRTVILAVEGPGHRVKACAVISHEPEIRFCFLDYLATRAKRAGDGLGGALYERIRSEAKVLGARGLFFECLPDSVEASPDPAMRRENASRLRFYERFGARPIMGTLYELPVKPENSCMPHLVYDGLDGGHEPSRGYVRRVVRAILERKYQHLCPPEYVERVVESIRDQPVKLRPPRYLPSTYRPPEVMQRAEEPVALLVTDRHELHHVRERGYVEAPVRLGAILGAIEPSGLFERVVPSAAPHRAILDVHDAGMVRYLNEATRILDPEQLLYPYVFPIRNPARPPRDASVRAGYYCIDTFTPISRPALAAARRGVDCAHAGALELLRGRRLAYALVRPPGHHAEHSVFGGFCYFNNAAIAAHQLSRHGRVAILDLDYHHGNGQQEIFWRRSDVFTISIHGNPRFAYPYFTGFDDERGEGPGAGFNLNLPLPERQNGQDVLRALGKAAGRIRDFEPMFLVLCLGLDTAKGDPTGTWSLRARDFSALGQAAGALGLPTLVVQEGGYKTRTLGQNVRAFFEGLLAGQRKAGPRLGGHGAAVRIMEQPARAPTQLDREPAPPGDGQGSEAGPEAVKAMSSMTGTLTYRTEPGRGDAERVSALVAATGMFHDYEVPVAAELVDERIAKGEASGYHFLFVEEGGELRGYACFGPVACTASSFDLFWIAVHPTMQGHGLGRRLIEGVEGRAREMGGTRIYIETSHREQYLPTRGFYQRCGYDLVSVLEDFYAPGDAKATYCKVLS